MLADISVIRPVQGPGSRASGRKKTKKSDPLYKVIPRSKGQKSGKRKPDMEHKGQRLNSYA
jgi:hypothetical protein